jgi:hypothetical protein
MAHNPRSRCCATNPVTKTGKAQAIPHWLEGIAIAEVFTEDYIAKIFLLENAVGHKVSYRILDPFHVHTESADGYVDMKRTAQRIAEFVGLTGLTFLIEPTHG